MCSFLFLNSELQLLRSYLNVLKHSHSREKEGFVSGPERVCLASPPALFAQLSQSEALLVKINKGKRISTCFLMTEMDAEVFTAMLVMIYQ